MYRSVRSILATVCFLPIILGLLCSCAEKNTAKEKTNTIKPTENAVKTKIDLPRTNQDLSWIKNEYNSKLLKKYSYGYWINGWKKHKGDASKNLLCLETGNYGVIFDMDSLDTPQFSILNDDANLMTTIESGTRRVAALDPAKLSIEVKLGGKKYRVKNCASEVTELRLRPISTMVSGLYVQRYRMDKLNLFDDAGTPLACLGSLELVAWPNSLTFTVELMPEVLNKKGATQGLSNKGEAQKSVVANGPDWSGATLSITLNTHKKSWTQKAEFKDWKYGQKNKVSLNCNINSESPQNAALEINFTLKDTKNTPVTTVAQKAMSYPVIFEPESNAYVTRIAGLKRTQNMRIPGGYDEFLLEINNKSSEIQEVPFHMILSKPFAGTCSQSILCYLDGTPTGITVQGNGTTYENGAKCFLTPYVLIPVNPGKTVLLYRIAYKYYGTVATAYAHQDQVHEAGYARWWQFAIGGAGETMTMDGDHGPTDQSICDVRALYIRKGLKGVTSNWTDAGWGGDWLRAFGKDNQKLVYNDMKAVSLVDGPCFTDLRFNGYYGSDRSVRVDSKVSTLRTDDYSRVFFDIRYDFNKTVSAKNVSFFSTGSTMGVPKISYGNLQGLIKEVSRENISNIVELREQLKPFNNCVIAGPGPWWVSTPANHRVDKKGGERRPMGATSLIIRSIEYNLGGKSYKEPTLRVEAVASNTFEGVKPALGAHTFIVPPVEVTEFKAGDSVHINVEWITPPRIADDYYGPNKAFQKWLQENPKSWKTAYREAKGNHLNVKVSGGTLIKNYPLIIKAESPELRFDIEGGVGYVPVRFEGLAAATGYTLYQIINNAEVALDQSSCGGNDFWQTVYDVPSNSYRISYNVCLDEYPTSKWVLKYKKK